MRIADMNWMQVERHVERDDRAVLPLGSTEQHAYLSLATDNILADRVAVEAAEPLGIPVFPVVNYGLTPQFTAFPGTVTLTEGTFFAVVREVVEGIVRSGFRRILIVNGHGGNAPAEAIVAEWAKHRGISVKFHNWWIGAKTIARVRAFDAVASHASWMENFAWTRLAGVEPPTAQKPMIDIAYCKTLDPVATRAYLGDGNFGGRYQRADIEMREIWQVAIEETRALLEPWS